MTSIDLGDRENLLRYYYNISINPIKLNFNNIIYI